CANGKRGYFDYW
nr:immunoglobulin heavy chain junction region [Mus musculus]